MESLIESSKEPGIIEPSCNPWSSPVMLVPKKDDTTRLCVDYRKLNEVIRKDSYPLPRIDDIFDVIHGAKWFCTLDLKSGYWQVRSALQTERRRHLQLSQLWQFTVLPFGLISNIGYPVFYFYTVKGFTIIIWAFFLSGRLND